jgi:competence protein ComGC
MWWWRDAAVRAALSTEVEEVEMKRLDCQRGLGAIGTLAALLILGLLIFAYAKNQVGDGKGGTGTPMTAIDKGRSAACQAQRRSIERDVVAWSVEHDGETPSISALESAGFGVSTCREGGEYSISGSRVTCSLHP